MVASQAMIDAANARNLERMQDYVTRSNAFQQRQSQTRRPPTHQQRTPAAPTPAPTPAPTSTTTGASPQMQAFNAFYGTPLYQVPLQQGLEALNANYAARGMLESGAAQKGISDYAAGMASGGLRDYFSLLGNQQAIGFNAASGQAGASQNFANSITGMNANYANALSGANSAYANNASNLYGNYAGGVGSALGGLGAAQQQGAYNTGNILSNSIMANANNTNSMIGGIGSALGGVAGYLAYRPYGG